MRAWAGIVGSLILLVLHATGAAQQVTGPPVSLDVDVVSPTSLHQPVVLYVVIRNGSANGVLVDLGRNRVGNTQVTVTPPTPGNRSVRIDERYPTGAGGLATRGTIHVGAGQTLEHEIVLNRWADFNAIGTYTIEADFLGRVESSDGRPIEVQRHWVKELRVTARNERELRVTCETLAKQIETTDDAQQLLNAIDKLSAVNDPVAVEYLRRAVKASRIVGDQAIRALERIGDDSARRVLSEVVDGPDFDHAEAARRALARLDQRAISGK